MHASDRNTEMGRVFNHVYCILSNLMFLLLLLSNLILYVEITNQVFIIQTNKLIEANKSTMMCHLSSNPNRARRVCDSSSNLFNNTFTSLRDMIILFEDVLLTSDTTE